MNKNKIRKIVTEAILKETDDFNLDWTEFCRNLSRGGVEDYMKTHDEPKTIEEVNKLIDIKDANGFGFFAQDRFRKLVNNELAKTKVMNNGQYFCYLRTSRNVKKDGKLVFERVVYIYGSIKYDFNKPLINNIRDLYLAVKANGCKPIKTMVQ